MCQRERAASVPGRRHLATAPIDVLVLDRQRTFADAVATWLQGDARVASATAVYSAQSARCMMAGSHIDVMLVDGDLPDNSALTLCAEVSSRDHPPRIIVLSASAEASADRGRSRCRCRRMGTQGRVGGTPAACDRQGEAGRDLGSARRVG